MFYFKLVVAFAFLHTMRAGCPSGWVYYSGSCYFIPNEAGTWFRLWYICLHSHKSYLAEVSSDGENDFLTNYIQGTPDYGFWLAGSDSIVEGFWVWFMTWRMVTYTKYAPYRPDNLFRHEHCLVLEKNSRWNDIYCRRKHHGICEKRLTQT